LLLLIVPLVTFQAQAGPNGKLSALHSLLFSLAGLLLIASALWLKNVFRRGDFQENEKILCNAEIWRQRWHAKNSPPSHPKTIP
jgi:hypothetical protein